MCPICKTELQPTKAKKHDERTAYTTISRKNSKINRYKSTFCLEEKNPIGSLTERASLHSVWKAKIAHPPLSSINSLEYNFSNIEIILTGYKNLVHPLD